MVRALFTEKLFGRCENMFKSLSFVLIKDIIN